MKSTFTSFLQTRFHGAFSSIVARKRGILDPMARFDMRCPGCGQIQEIQGQFGTLPSAHCDTCDTEMMQYFGIRMAPMMNLGYQEARYSNDTDRNIAKYQFEHL